MLKVYQCEKCGKTVISKEELKLEGFKELVANTTDAAQEKHVPMVAKKCKTVQVDVGSVAHPMTEEHLIVWVALETEKGYQVQYLKANDVPVCTFKLADGDSAVAVYAYCNLHGLWKN
ncbi:MAG: desulfoferrodoxin [Clostridia bacterium]|nr:desulfoferrodoxin [Clostridia bacterium]